MRQILQRVLKWNTLTKDQQESLHGRFDKVRYGFFFWISHVVSFLPINAGSIFYFCLTDKEAPGKHHYGAGYQDNLRRLKYRRVRLLEIGIGGYGFSLGGQSLNAWHCYFPFGTIVGCDIQDKISLQNWRTKIRKVDQSEAGDLIRLAETDGPFDIIVDDGSHASEHQILSFRILFEHLKDGGVYCIEDVQTSFWTKAGISDGDGFRETCVGFFLELTKYLNHREFLKNGTYDASLLKLAAQITHIEFRHNLVFVTKGYNDFPSNIEHL